MSYDLKISVKVEGTDLYATVKTPEYDSPTYNLGLMFREATGWNYKQGERYKCSEVIGNIERGIRELHTKPGWYRQYEPDNGWGTVESALQALESLRECIYETAEVIPAEHLYVAW